MKFRNFISKFRNFNEKSNVSIIVSAGCTLEELMEKCCKRLKLEGPVVLFYEFNGITVCLEDDEDVDGITDKTKVHVWSEADYKKKEEEDEKKEEEEKKEEAEVAKSLSSQPTTPRTYSKEEEDEQAEDEHLPSTKLERESYCMYLLCLYLYVISARI